jgi:ribonucleotide monophosphatase NagD (HAD superfamily)
MMVGDSLEHDIAGAQAVGIASAFIRDGIHANDFTGATSETLISEICDRLVAQAGIRPPDFSLKYLA